MYNGGMSCFHPRRIFYTGRKTEAGAKEILFTSNNSEVVSLAFARRKYPDLQFDPFYMFLKDGDAYLYRSEEVPCGQCRGCLFDYAKQWSIRCQLEASFYDFSYFLTITYDDEHYAGELSKRDIQLFMKRLRKKFGEGIRFFLCGERGEITHRAHYHMIAFGLELNDLVPWSSDLWTSESLDNVWQKGNILVGLVSDEACAYVARYCDKKKGGKDSDEFLLMSRRPGIGKRYYDMHGDMFGDGKIYHHHNIGNTYAIPRYFKYLEKKDNRDTLEFLSARLKPVLAKKGAVDVVLLGYDPLDPISLIGYRDLKERQFIHKVSVLHRAKV